MWHDLRPLKEQIEPSMPASPPLNVVIWGTYDLGKPRTRLMVEAIRNSGANVTEVHVSVWDGAEDKSVLGKMAALGRILRWLAAYPVLLWRLAFLPRPDVIVVGYLGHVDVLVLWPYARLRKIPVVWDAFLSLYDTVVDDRKMVSPRHPLAWILKWWEWLSCRAAERIVLDTDAQADLFRDTYNLDRARATSVFVGAELSAFPISRAPELRRRSKVLFYGQFIPLHGIATIIEAARLARNKPIDWMIIGTGQMAADIRQMLAKDPPAALTWQEWVPYRDLNTHIAEADICLGVFGESSKAGRVIPNKVFQILSAGRPLVTRDGPGIRELVGHHANGVVLVPPADPVALLAAIEQLEAQAPFPPELHADLRAQFSLEALTRRWDEILREGVRS